MGVYLVYRNYVDDNEDDVFEGSYILKPIADCDFFSTMNEVETAIRLDSNNDFYENGDTCEYCIIDLLTKEIKTLRATYILTPSIIIE